MPSRKLFQLSDFSQVGVKALDDYTLEYTLETNAPWFLTLTGYSALAPLSRDYYVEGIGEAVLGHLIALGKAGLLYVLVAGYSALAPLSRDYYTSQGGKFGTEFDSAAARGRTAEDTVTL